MNFLLQGVLPEAFEKVDNAEIKEIIEGCIRNKKGSRYVRKFQNHLAHSTYRYIPSFTVC